ncbi:uncharacterized protein LOC135223114 [Macrobrachium nipponense]|uniref:uncharacterized protein LOC135223114 n=1 Tax=Macrobrachium nipponense TaxID=159736 RepID=UPI0030C81654
MCGIKLDSNRDNDSIKVAVENRSEIVNKGNEQGSSVNFAGAALHNVASTNVTCTILQTAKVSVVESNGIPIEARALFDSGSDRTYVSSNIVKKCKPEWITSQPLTYSVFGGDNSSKSSLSNIYKLKVLDRNNLSHLLTTVETPKIRQPLIRPVILNMLNAFSHVQLADDYQNNSYVNIDILIGLDAYWQFIKSDDVIQFDGIVAQNSVFGWVLSGAWHTNPSYPCTSSQMLCISKVCDYDISKFWDLESVGISPKESNNQLESNFTLQEFSEKIQIVEGRCEVALPWKSETAKSDLMDNKKLALRRLNKLHCKLDKDVKLKTIHYKVFDEYEKEGIIEGVPSNEISSAFPIFYMPHRPDVREASTSTKCKMTEVIQELKENMYVDNWWSGADSFNETHAKFSEARKVLSLAAYTSGLENKIVQYADDASLVGVVKSPLMRNKAALSLNQDMDPNGVVGGLQRSFILYTVGLWNSLPKDVVQSEFQRFK